MEQGRNSGRKPTRRQWIMFAIVTTLYLIFLIWVRSWWGLIVVPFIFDAYITKKIPWYFWKKSKNPTVRSIMSWVDAIVFALVAVYFVNIYFFQNYQIPSSSLEKSLLVGDFLFVSKMSYGPRVPNTPLSMPLAQHTLPIVNTKSYIEWPQWDYKRVKGFGDVKLNDIVVFNFPAGDTVATAPLYQARDFYSIAYELGAQKFSNSNVNMDSLTREQQRIVYDTYYNAGRKQILSYPQEYGEVVSRPVDRRENYVKRCVGMPGDTFQIIDRLVYLNGAPIQEPLNVQFSYIVYTTGKPIPIDYFRQLGISNEDIRPLNRENSVYYLPLTHEMYNTLSARTDIIARIEREPDSPGGLYPPNLHTNWTRNDYGPVWIPKKGETIQLTEDNYPIYERPIRVYEENDLEIRNGQIYINGVQTNSYTFKMDYYWMMGDNRNNSADSRYWGFVPEDHVVGKPILIWLSLDKDRGWFEGKIRWNRIFKLVDNIK